MITAHNTCNDFGYNNTPFATKGAALGTSIPALALGGLAFLQNGGLGNLFGIGNNIGAAALAGQGVYQNEISKLQSENAALKQGQVTDAKLVEVVKDGISQNEALRTEMYAFIKPIAEEAAANRERVAVLEAQQKCDAEKIALMLQNQQKDIALAKAELRGEIAQVASSADCCCKQLSTAIAGLQATMASITKTVIPNSAICPGWGNVTVTPATAPAAA